MTDLYFVREGDRIYTARKELGYIYRDVSKKETSELEIISPIPHDVVKACVSGVKVLNLGKTLGFAKERT